eukprot:gene1351-1883_t
MQKRAAEDLKKLLMDALSKAGFLPGGMETFSAPRRLVAVVEGLPERTADDDALALQVAHGADRRIARHQEADAAGVRAFRREVDKALAT